MPAGSDPAVLQAGAFKILGDGQRGRCAAIGVFCYRQVIDKPAGCIGCGIVGEKAEADPDI